MVLYWSMFLYVGVFGYITQFYYQQSSKERKYESKVPLVMGVVLLAVPVFFIGMRSDYGDTYAYINSFNNMTSDFSELWAARTEIKGFGYELYVFFIKNYISSDPNVYLMITATIQACGILKIYYKYSTNFTYSLLLFFLSMAFLYMMNGIRQFMAACIVFLFSDSLFKRRTLRFLLVVLLASTIHSSVLLWIPVYFVVQGKPWNLKVILAIVSIVVVILALDSFTDILSDSLEGTNYEDYTNQFEKDDGSSIVHTLIAFIPVVLAFWKRREIEEKNNKIISIIVNCVVVEVLINLLANFTSGILIGRLPIYFKPLGFILLPWMMDNVIDEKDRRMVRNLCMIGYVLFALYYMYSMNIYYLSVPLGLDL